MVIGLGKVGILVANLLKETGYDITGIDLQQKPGQPFDTKALDVSNLSLVSDTIEGLSTNITQPMPTKPILPKTRKPTKKKRMKRKSNPASFQLRAKKMQSFTTAPRMGLPL